MHWFSGCRGQSYANLFFNYFFYGFFWLGRQLYKTAQSTPFIVPFEPCCSFIIVLFLYKKNNMKTIFDTATGQELIGRVNLLTKRHAAQWGEMNVYQMTKHCVIWNNWVLGKNQFSYTQGFLGWVFGKMALRGLVSNERPMKKNMPAGPFAVKEKEGDVELQKNIWIEQIGEYQHYSNPDFIHDFFGKMKMDEIGILVYKHFDHHLRQFNV